MNIIIKRIDKSLPLPEYKTSGAVAFDLAAREEVHILPKAIGYVPLNVVVKVPEGHMLQLAARSSLHKRGLIPANAIGFVDQDYCGDNDELKAALYNFSDSEVVIGYGERIMQGAIIPILQVDWREVDLMHEEDRGGFGTTGNI